MTSQDPITQQPTTLDREAFLLTSAVPYEFYGIGSICNYHDLYCTGTDQQFSSNQECRDFLSALPQIDPVAGPEARFAGNSSNCRFKHHLMIPFDRVHCKHIGRGNYDNNFQIRPCTPDEYVLLPQISSTGPISEPPPPSLSSISDCLAGIDQTLPLTTPSICGVGTE